MVKTFSRRIKLLTNAAALAAASIALLVAAPACVAATTMPMPVEHIAPIEHIISFNSQITPLHDGSVGIAETIVYDFPSPKHGIFRDIPTDYQDEQGRHHHVAVSDTSAKDETGKPYPLTQTEVSGQGTELKIGDPASTLAGHHTYLISYKLSTLDRSTPAGDLIRLDAVGDKWEVPVDQATVTVLGSKVSESAPQTACYLGASGTSGNTGCVITPAGSTVTVASSRPLQAGEGLTVDLLWPANTFTAHLLPATVSPLRATDVAGGLLAGLGSLVALSAGVLWLVRRSRNWSAKRRQTVIAQYESPDGLTPGELGLLADDRANMTEITAMLIDLAVRGYIKITQTSRREWYRHAEYTFTKLKKPDDLRPFELRLFTAVMGSKSEQTIKDVDRQGMVMAIAEVKKELADSLGARGYYVSAGKKRATTRTLLFVLLGATPIIAGLLFALSPVTGGLAVLGFGALVLYLVATSKKLTQTGYAEWAKVEGFKLFLSVTEEERLKFSDAPDKTPELFSKHLPAAVALGVEKQWAKQFADLDITQATNNWYSGAGAAHLTTAVLAADLAGSFGSAIASGFSPQTSSSGFGGGSVGGGFGGGGGGSW